MAVLHQAAKFDQISQTMKKFLTVMTVFLAALVAKAETADEIISKYLSAAGGAEKLGSVKSLQFVQTVNLATPMGDMQITLTHIKVQNKLMRLNTSSELFGNAYSVVTDTSGWIMIPASQFTGSEAILQKLKPEERNAMKSQMDCAGFFPELVNYASKGYVAELAGEGKVNGRASFKVKLKKDKDERLYFFDKQTGLVNAMTVKGAAAAAMMGLGTMQGGGRMDKAEATLNFSDYKDVSGLKIPGRMTIETPMGMVGATIGFVSINQPVDAKWYRAE